MHATNCCDECGDRAVEGSDTPVSRVSRLIYRTLSLSLLQLSARENKRSNPMEKIPALVHFGAWKRREMKWEAPKAETKSHGSKALI